MPEWSRLQPGPGRKQPDLSAGNSCKRGDGGKRRDLGANRRNAWHDSWLASSRPATLGYDWDGTFSWRCILVSRDILDHPGQLNI